MSGWKRIVRGILGMGLTFGAIGGAFFGALAIVAAVFFPHLEDEPGFMFIAGTVWSTAIGLSFSTALALAGRFVSFDRLSVPKVFGIGGGGGVALAALLVFSTPSEWATLGDAMVPFIFLPMLGAGSATAALLIARRAAPALLPGDDELALGGEGVESIPADASD